MANLRANNLTGTGGRNAIEGSLEFTASKGFLTVTLDAIGTSDFTIEWWFKAENRSEPGTANRRMFALGANNATGSMSINYDAVNNDIQWNYNDTSLFSASTLKVYDNEWYHIAAVREGTGSNETKLYINGVLSDTGTLSQDFTQTALQIGLDTTLSSDFGFYGDISNLRVTKRALYTSAFTPSTEKLIGVVDTILLCCQDSDNALQEASGTGKTITGYGRYFAATGEKFANTGFTADSNWTKGAGWTIANGLATHAQGSAGDLYQAVSGLDTNTIYKLSVDIISTDNDVSYFFIDDDPGGNYPALGNGSNTYVGHHYIFFKANAATMNIGFRGSSLWAGTLTNLRLSSADRGELPKAFPSVGVDEGVVFEGDTKVNSQGYMYFPTGDTEQRGRGRGVFGGGYRAPWATSDNLNSFEYFNIQTTGSVVDFGDRSVEMNQGLATVASSTRGVMMGGRGYNYPSPGTNTSTDTIDYVTIANTGNATDFGNLVHGSTYVSAAGGNSTRGVLFRSSDADMEYITIATTGNSVDTGSDSTVGRNTFSGSASQTRAFWAGGANPSGGAAIGSIDYLEIASLGVPQDFGDLTFTGHNQAASSNTRGIIFTGGFPSAASNTINYITIASTGNAKDFGDLSGDNISSHSSGSGCSNNIRAVRCGGYVSPTSINRIDYVSIQSTGNAQDFGDLITIRHAASGFSDSHGGL